MSMYILYPTFSDAIRCSGGVIPLLDHAMMETPGCFPVSVLESREVKVFIECEVVGTGATFYQMVYRIEEVK